MKKSSSIKPLKKCFAVVKKNRPKIKAMELYEDDNVMLRSDEMLIRVEVIPLNQKRNV